MNYTQLTIELTKQIPKNIKKANGIYITPRSIITKLWSELMECVGDISSIKRILEPSCGTCEIIHAITPFLLPDTIIDAIEKTDVIFTAIHGLNFSPIAVNICHADFMKHDFDNTYDLIIGNPPYVVLNKNDVPESYIEYVNGKSNLFGLFLIRSIQLLNPGGIMAMVLPKSLLNSGYYSKIRQYIVDNGEILKIVDFETTLESDFIETDQSTIGFIFQKNPVSEKALIYKCRYHTTLLDKTIFTTNLSELEYLFEDCVHLSDLGCVVKTGNVVWNQHKEKMTDDFINGTVLLYNTNISMDDGEGKIVLRDFTNGEKKQYIRMKTGAICEPSIVVNRGNGNSAYKLGYCLVSDYDEYFVENHLNTIICVSNISIDEKRQLYENIIRSFQNPKTQLFVKLFLGNNGLSKSELENIFPIYL
jgi:hypothetical protein